MPAFQFLINPPGLSLCIQGTPAYDFAAPLPIRFIPVYTGNTLGYRGFHYRKSVYPCVYREHNYYQSTAFDSLGLSLCIQGTQLEQAESQNKERFIPVYTGNTHLQIQ